MIKGGAQTHWIEEQKVPYLVMNDQWIGYDDAQSLTIKVSFFVCFLIFLFHSFFYSFTCYFLFFYLPCRGTVLKILNKQIDPNIFSLKSVLILSGSLIELLSYKNINKLTQFFQMAGEHAQTHIYTNTYLLLLLGHAGALGDGRFFFICFLSFCSTNFCFYF